MAIAIGRRQLISSLCGAAVAWPLATRAQQLAIPVVGVLHSASPDPRSSYWSAMAAFRRGVSDFGFLEGKNVSFEFRWAENQFARLPTLAAELVRRNVSLIFAGGGDVAALAAKNVTTTIPIVFAIGADPVEQGTLLAPKLQLQPRLVLPTGITFGFFGGILGGMAALSGPLVFIFLLAKGLRGKAFTKEASLFLVVSSVVLLAILLTASLQFNRLDVSVSTAATLPVVLGMYVGQHLRDKIAPETFKKLVLIAVIAAGAELLRHGFFS